MTRPLLVVLAMTLQLVAGFLYVSSGLVAPVWAVVVLLLAWGVLTVVAITLARQGSWRALLVPVASVVLWFAVISAGGAWLGWTA